MPDHSCPGCFSSDTETSDKVLFKIMDYYLIKLKVMHLSSASPRGGGPRANVGTLQMSSTIAPPTGASFFIKFPTLSPVPGALQLRIILI